MEQGTRARPPKGWLAELGLRPKKSFGQNFLHDPAITERIATLAAPKGAGVVELGAGLGALTRPLLARAQRLIAVERDRDLVPVLRQEFQAAELSGQLRVLEADAKSLALAELFADLPRPHVLCGNLPYQITGPLLELATRSVTSLDRAVFLIQLEVAARLAAQPGGDDWGGLSVFVQAAFDVTKAFVVRRGAFFPEPNVDSAVVLLTPKAERIVETATFAALVRAAFEQRRKKLSNAWRAAVGLSTEDLALAAKTAGVNLDDRGERLTVRDFERMAKAVEELSR